MPALPIIEARKQLTKLPERFKKNPELSSITVTRRGEPVLTVMPHDLYEALIETLDILGDDELMSTLRQSIEDLKQNKTIPWEEVKKELAT